MSGTECQRTDIRSRGTGHRGPLPDPLAGARRGPVYRDLEGTELRAEHGIATEAWSPLAQGAALSNTTITRLADHYGVTPAQVVLRRHLQIGNIVILQSVTPARIRENVNLFTFTLSPEDLATIATLETGNRIGPDPATFDLR